MADQNHQQEATQIVNYSAISDQDSTSAPCERDHPAVNESCDQQGLQMRGYFRRWYERHVTGAPNERFQTPDNLADSDHLLPRPVPDHSSGDRGSNIVAWWDVLPAPVKDFLYLHRWWFIGALIFIIIVVIIVLASTGNYAYIPLFLRIMMCSFFKDYFNNLCTFDTAVNGKLNSRIYR